MFEVELFNAWYIDFMAPFLNLCGHKYIFVVVDYISKQVEDISLVDNEGKSVVAFLKQNSHFGTPNIIISDVDSHFCNMVSRASSTKYRVKQIKVESLYYTNLMDQWTHRTER